jgi:hypothetical protein
VHLLKVKFELNLQRILLVAMLAGKLLDAQVNRVDVIHPDVLSSELLVAPVASQSWSHVDGSLVQSEIGAI